MLDWPDGDLFLESRLSAASVCKRVSIRGRGPASRFKNRDKLTVEPIVARINADFDPEPTQDAEAAGERLSGNCFRNCTQPGCWLVA